MTSKNSENSDKNSTNDYVLAIDPGNDTGWAIFKNRALCACGLGSPSSSLRVPCMRVVIELPQVYPSRVSKGDPNDLIKVAVQVGEYKERFGGVAELVLPRQWKGALPKDVCHARAWAKLADVERDVVYVTCKTMSPSKRHNVLDAVCLGVWTCKR